MDAIDKFHVEQAARKLRSEPWAEKRGLGFGLHKDSEETRRRSTALIIALADSIGLIRPMLEVQFFPGRKWRFDLAWPAPYCFAVEIEGGTFARGAHTRGKGYAENIEKYNAACIIGWRVLRFTTDQVQRIEYPKLILENVKNQWERSRQPSALAPMTSELPTQSERSPC